MHWSSGNPVPLPTGPTSEHPTVKTWLVERY